VLTEDYFTLFGLPARHKQDTERIASIWKDLAACVHPDRYATANLAEQRVAMQWAAHINDAYQTLRDPLLRAAYLCERAGVDMQRNSAMDPAFLAQQIEWRERLDAVRGDAAALVELVAELDITQEALEAEVGRLLDDESDPQAAAQRVHEWMFLSRLAKEVDDAYEAARGLV